jgi:RNA polymerase sigma factor (TIGR02999 family)
MDSSEVTRLLREIHNGNKGAVDDLMPVVYPELHHIALNYFRRERRDHTLSPTALVNEAYLRLVGQHAVDFTDRLQFLGVAAVLMRRILVNHARDHNAVKRGRGIVQVTLDDALTASDQRSDEVVAIDDALERLSVLDPQQSRVVELHFFGGLTFEEISSLMNLSLRTVKRRWESARAWLNAEMAPCRSTRAAAP